MISDDVIGGTFNIVTQVGTGLIYLMKVVYYVTVDCGFGWGVQNIKVNRLQFLYDLCCQNKQY